LKPSLRAIARVVAESMPPLNRITAFFPATIYFPSKVHSAQAAQGIGRDLQMNHVSFTGKPDYTGHSRQATIQPSYIAAHLDIICFAGLLREYFDAVNLGILYVAYEAYDQLSIGNGQGFDCFNHRLLESAGFFIRVEILKNCLFVDCD